MINFMKEVATQGSNELTGEERNLLSVAYKNTIGARRASWRIVSSIEQREVTRGNDTYIKQIKSYRSKIESELKDICHDILSVLDDHLIANESTDEGKVFYYKM